jgi:hypothetical protein
MRGQYGFANDRIPERVRLHAIPAAPSCVTVNCVVVG